MNIQEYDIMNEIAESGYENQRILTVFFAASVMISMVSCAASRECMITGSDASAASSS